mgnify:CR=1 FL=1
MMIRNNLGQLDLRKILKFNFENRTDSVHRGNIAATQTCFRQAARLFSFMLPTLNPLNFKGSFPQTLGVINPSTYSGFHSKTQPNLSQISKNFNNQNKSFLGIKNELVCGGMNQPTLRIIKSLNIQEIQLKNTIKSCPINKGLQQHNQQHQQHNPTTSTT